MFAAVVAEIGAHREPEPERGEDESDERAADEREQRPAGERIPTRFVLDVGADRGVERSEWRSFERRCHARDPLWCDVEPDLVLSRTSRSDRVDRSSELSAIADDRLSS